MITREEILMGRDKLYPLTNELESNLNNLLIAVNKLRALYGKPMFISSGYRPAEFNKAAGGSKNSAHLFCLAVDFKDSDGLIKKFCTEEILIQCGLYLENPINTPSWCHVQIRPTNKRIFNL